MAHHYYQAHDMLHITVYSAVSTPRLSYCLHWLLTERLQIAYTLTNNLADLQHTPYAIAYGNTSTNAVSIPASGLLQQNHIEAQQVSTGMWQDVPTLFDIPGADTTLPFDLLSGIFYLLSRYEEYLNYTPDKHSRFPATESILYRINSLEIPLIDEWVYRLIALLNQQWNTKIKTPGYSYTPSYDIDIAYSHSYKGVARLTGAYLRAILKGDLEQIAERTKVLKKKIKDPFDSFNTLKQLHSQNGLQPIYFILCALKTTPFDKNIHPQHPAMMRVIKQLDKEGQMGIHPSYYAYGKEVLFAEKNTLEQIIGHRVNISRQHYIKVHFPQTCINLMKAGIAHDYSMGYGTHLGYRAGTGNAFMWYNLQENKATTLRIHPFCFMDTTAHYEQHLSPEQANEKLSHMLATARRTGSNCITIFHNFSLGAAKEWDGWLPMYTQFLQEATA